MIARAAKIAVFAFALAFSAACDSSVTQPALKSGSSGAMANGGNSGAAKACQNNGYLNFQRPDGTTFRNVGECVAFVATGGTLLPIGGAPTIIEIDSHGISCTGPISTWTVTVFITYSGGTGTVNGTPIASGVDLTIPQSGDGLYEFVVSNGTQSVSETRMFTCT